MTEEAAFTVGRLGSIFTWNAEQGCMVNGEPYDPDEDGVHQPGPSTSRHGPLPDEPAWGQSFFMPEEPRDAFAAAEMERGKRMEALYREYERIYGDLLRNLYRAILNPPPPPPGLLARIGGWLITGWVLVRAVRGR